MDKNSASNSALNSLESTLKYSELINASEKLKLDPENPSCRLMYSRAADEASQSDLYDYCIQLLTESVESIVLGKIERDDSLMFQLYYRIASIQYGKGEMDACLENVNLCNELIQKCGESQFTETDFGLLHHLWACAYSTKKMINEAVEHFNKVCKMSLVKL